MLERFGPILDPKSILCTDGSNILRAFARKMKVDHHVFVASKREFKQVMLHIQNVNAYQIPHECP